MRRPQKRDSGSPHPLDHFFDPLDQFLDPLDQANGKPAFPLPSLDSSPESAIDVVKQGCEFESEGDFDSSTVDFTADDPAADDPAADDPAAVDVATRDAPAVDVGTHDTPAFDV